MYHLALDREKIRAWIDSFGRAAPLVFIGFQIFQVLFAPFPGEVSGLVGGYLFGTLTGFIYSTIGLSLGSWIIFFAGRFLGKNMVRRFMAPDKMARFDRMFKRHGIFLSFLSFLFPGFPKDYICLFLGVTPIPTPVFIFISAVGRMPGTLMLSLQGAAFYQKNYFMLAAMLLLSAALAALAFRFRRQMSQWAERYDSPDS